jgi:predicted permease
MFTVVAVTSVALGVSVTCAIFAFLNALVLNYLPYPHAERMVQIGLVNKAGESRGAMGLSGREFVEFQKIGVLEDALAWTPWMMTMSGESLPESLTVGQFSGNVFSYYGVTPAIGRVFTAADAPVLAEPPAVAVLGYRFWQSHYGGDASVLGKSMRLDSHSYTIVGVASENLRWGNFDVYMPLQRVTDPRNIFVVEARLKSDITDAAAEGVLQPWVAELARIQPRRFPQDFHVRLQHLMESRTARFRDALMMLFAAALLLLVVGCTNLSILLMARGAAREQEVAVRSAIGASRARLLAQQLTESLLLTAIGSGLGVILARFGVPFIVQWMPANYLPTDAAIEVNSRVLLLSIAVAVITGVVFGVWPALQATRRLSVPLATRVVAGQRKRSHSFAIATQVALTVLLLTGAGAALRGFLMLTQTSLGYNPHNVLVARAFLAEGTYHNWEERFAYFERLRSEVASNPGAEAVTLTYFCCTPSAPPLMPVEVDGRPDIKDQPVDVQRVTPTFFSVFEIPLKRGRIWSESDNSRAAHVALIDERAAKRLWPDRDPIGQRIRLPLRATASWQVAAPSADEWLEVIGVVGDVPTRGLRESGWPAVYVPNSILVEDLANLIIRTRGEPRALLQSVREQIHRVDPNQTLASVTTADEVLRSVGWGREQVVASIFLVIGVIGLALASVGLYSVVSYVASQRTREFGIRLALGGRTFDVMWIAIRSTMIAVAAGAVAGLVLSLALDRVALRYIPVNTRDLPVLSVVVILLLAVSVAACLAPARRAARVDATIALR